MDSNGKRFAAWVQSIHFALTLAIALFLLRQYAGYRDYREEAAERVQAVVARVAALEKAQADDHDELVLLTPRVEEGEGRIAQLESKPRTEPAPHAPKPEARRKILRR